MPPTRAVSRRDSAHDAQPSSPVREASSRRRADARRRGGRQLGHSLSRPRVASPRSESGARPRARTASSSVRELLGTGEGCSPSARYGSSSVREQLGTAAASGGCTGEGGCCRSGTGASTTEGRRCHLLVARLRRGARSWRRTIRARPASHPLRARWGSRFMSEAVASSRCGGRQASGARRLVALRSPVAVVVCWRSCSTRCAQAPAASGGHGDAAPQSGDLVGHRSDTDQPITHTDQPDHAHRSAQRRRRRCRRVGRLVHRAVILPIHRMTAPQIGRAHV